MFRRDPRVAAPGAKSVVSECILFKLLQILDIDNSAALPVFHADFGISVSVSCA